MSVTPIPSTLRRAVIERDGTLCLKCSVQTTPDWWGPTALHIDHIKPESRGGLTVLSNLQVLCQTCNLAKGATYADYRKNKDAPGLRPWEWLKKANELEAVAGHRGKVSPRAFTFSHTVICECGKRLKRTTLGGAVSDYSKHLDDVATPEEQERSLRTGIGA